MFALELETYRRCFPRNGSSLHCRDTTGASALTSCETSPPQLFCRLTVHSSRSSFWTRLTDGGPKAKTTTLTLLTSIPLAASVYIHFKLHTARYPDPVPYQFPDPQQPARPLADLFTAIAALLAKRQPHNAPLLHPAWTTQEVVTEEYRWGQSTTSLAPTRQQLGSKSSSSASPCGVSSSPSCLSARSFHWFLPTWSATVDSRPSHVGGSAWFLSCAFWICLQMAGVCLR